MRPQSKREKGATFMLVDGAAGNVRRFRITPLRILLALALWAVALLLFGLLGFQIG